ncbi:SPRY domain-containing protein [uncultured Paenibacillus sp.]|uniref:SPRY domain-containing protein n=1 Tax=uncultured Paenibacillus sp. TaxID=227322 RepID=UPI0035A595E2
MGVQLIYLDPNDTSGTVTLSNNNLTASMPSGTIIRANYAHIKGKYYFEVKLDSGTTIMQFGIASKLISIPSPTSVYVRCINGGNGNRYPENTSYGTGWVVGDVIGVALDLDSGKLEFYKNGVNMGISHTDLNNLISQYGEIVPYFRSGSTNPVITVNFGASAFKYTVPVGYYPYNYSTSNKFLISSENEYYSLTPEVYSTETAIPTMTSNTTPNGRAFASSVSSSTYEPWRAFDKADGGTYLSVGATTSGYLALHPAMPPHIALQECSEDPQ